MARPKKALITRDMATRAALAIIDTDGLDGFSLNSVARAMGVKAPSLYYHFSDKAELLSEVARLVLLDTHYRPDMAASWEDRTIQLCLETRRGLLKHPRAAQLILQFFPRHVLLYAYEDAAKDYPHVPGLVMAMMEGVEKLTFGSALFEAAAISRGVAAMPPFDSAAYPNLAAAIEDNGGDDEANFVEAMRMLLAGIRLRAEQVATA